MFQTGSGAGKRIEISGDGKKNEKKDKGPAERKERKQRKNETGF